MVRVTRKRSQIPCRRFRRYVSWTHVYPTVLVLSRSDQPGQNYDSKSVPLCLVRSVRLCYSYSVTRILVCVTRKRYQNPMALWKLVSRTIQRYWSYRDRTNLVRITTRNMYRYVWYAVSDCAIVTAIRVNWQPPNS
jgi:hypothetical protein